jgi:hypothetical protein
MKKLTTIILLGVSIASLAQPTDMNQADNGKFAPYMGKAFVLFVDKPDTLFCEKVELFMKGYDVQEVAYTVDNKKTHLKGKDVAQLQSFYAENRCLMELMPLNPEKPEGRKTHLFKNLVGYFTIWTNNHRALFGLQQFNWGGGQQSFPTTVQFVSIEGGSVATVTRKFYKERIDPLLVACKGIQSHEVHGFLGFNYMELADKCFDYNRLCAPDYNWRH